MYNSSQLDQVYLSDGNKGADGTGVTVGLVKVESG